MKNNIKFLNLTQDPFDLFAEWFSLAEKKEINDPNAMNLSTLDSDLQPSSRIVLMKSFDQNGFVFNTNLNSKKSLEIKNNSLVNLNFYWKSLHKQIRIKGNAIELNESEADFYFDKRPEKSKIGAWASNQSDELISRNDLMARFKAFEKKFKNTKIARPPHWSGYRVQPDLFEFWQEVPFRLHDRVEYNKIKNGWKARRLFP